MIRFLAIFGLHILLNFILLGDNPLVSHPVHHDDYGNLSARLSDYRVTTPRPVSTLVIASLGSLGREYAYAGQNLLLVTCVFLCIRLAELVLRSGRPLPPAGFLAAGAMALSFPSVVDWTKYLGLLTNLTSATFGLIALCLSAKLDNDVNEAPRLVPWILLSAALSFLAKEDFAVPLLLAAAAFAIVGTSRLWLQIGIAMISMFGAVLALNRLMGSVFVSGMTNPDDPYFISFAPLSVLRAYDKWLLGGRFQLALLGATLAASLAAVVVHRRERMFAIRIALLALVPLGLLAPYAIFPNHAFAYYALLPFAMFAALLATATYATDGTAHAH